MAKLMMLSPKPITRNKKPSTRPFCRRPVSEDHRHDHRPGHGCSPEETQSLRTDKQHFGSEDRKHGHRTTEENCEHVKRHRPQQDLVAENEPDTGGKTMGEGFHFLHRRNRITLYPRKQDYADHNEQDDS